MGFNSGFKGLNIGEKHIDRCPTVYYHTNTFYNILINLLKQSFNKTTLRIEHNTFYNILINLLKQSFNNTTLRIEHNNAEHKGTVESHNIVVNKTRIILF